MITFYLSITQKTIKMKKITIFTLAILAYAFSHAQCTIQLGPMAYIKITTNTTINGIGTNYWICSGLTVTIASSVGDNFICESNVTLNVISPDADGDNVYAKPGCIINNSSNQPLSVICDISTVTFNNSGSSSIIPHQCSPVIYDYSLIGGPQGCDVAGSVDENQWNFNMKINPNPFAQQTTFETDKVLKNATLIIYNSFGQRVKQIDNLCGQTIVFHRDNLPDGLYFVYVTEDNKTITADKLIISDK